MNIQYHKRIEKLQDYLSAQGIDAMLVTTQDSIFYLSGASYIPLERPFFIVVKPTGVPSLVVPALEREHMAKVEGLGEIKSYFEYLSLPGENWYDRLAELTGTNAIVGIEPALPSGLCRLIRAKDTLIVGEIDHMRMIKDEQEIAAVRYASEWTDKGMELLHRSLYRGENVLETTMPARTLQTGVIKATDYNYLTSSFLTAGWPAPKSAQPHSLPDLHMKMGDGPIVLMSFNRVNGYAAECERTVFLGEPGARECELFGYMTRAREIAFSMVRSGARCSEIDMATRDYFISLGYGDNILHRAGHGIGMGNHEAPWISAGSGDVLEENMIISIEPAIYFDDLGGFRHSDTVLVTKDGYELLTRYPFDLDSMIVRERRALMKLKGAIVRGAVNY